ncbi:hypothetical protein [Sinobaca qinghaiensis]|nr:hypothetical protein [Sinobaca qinghaiensis]
MQKFIFIGIGLDMGGITHENPPIQTPAYKKTVEKENFPDSF